MVLSKFEAYGAKRHLQILFYWQKIVLKFIIECAIFGIWTKFSLISIFLIRWANENISWRAKCRRHEMHIEFHKYSINSITMDCFKNLSQVSSINLPNRSVRSIVIERKREGEKERQRERNAFSSRIYSKFTSVSSWESPRETSIRIAYYSTIHWNGLDRYKARGRLINSIAPDKANYSSFNHRDICFGCKSNFGSRSLYLPSFDHRITKEVECKI